VFFWCIQKDLQNLEDAETELLMLDEEDRIPYPVSPYSCHVLNFLTAAFAILCVHITP